jgi:hypothetical protein
VWPTIPIPLRLELGDAGRRLLNGTTSWDDNAASAMADWNAVVAVFVQQATAPNVVRWAGPGEDLNALVATTRKEYGLVNGRFAITRATTLLNPEFCWDAYDGPLRSGLCHGQWQVIVDLRRTVLHELGHVLGLEHPDEGGQTVAAIMNHTTSDVDTLQADDEAGIRALYPPPPVAAPRQDVSAAAAAGGQGGGGGCAMGPGEADVILALLVVVILGRWLYARVFTE